MWVLGGVQRFCFIKQVRPGDTLRIEINVVKLYQQMAIVEVSVKVDNELVAQGQLTFGAVKDESTKG